MTERKRAIGFALMDTAFAADAKFLRLLLKAPGPKEYAAAVGVFWLLLADARRARDPEVGWDDYQEYDEQIALLREVKLLIGSGFDPVSFSVWAPAYRGVSERTPGTVGYGAIRKGTESTPTSDQVISTHVTNGVGGVGEGESQSFMRYPPRKPRDDSPNPDRPTPNHDGHHGPTCTVCAPLLVKP